MPSAKRQKKNPPSKPNTSGRLHIALAVSALIVITLIAYHNAISNNFVWDDHEQIVLNPALRPAAPLSHIFSSDIRFAHQDTGVQNRTYRPLQMLTYRLVASTFGFTPAPFHLCNLLLAILTVLAAFAVFRLLTQNLFSAFVASSLFAVYPIHTEAVDWIASLPDLGCTLFILISFSLFLASRKTESTNSSKLLYIVSITTYAVSLLWKETAVVLPFLVIAYVLLLEKDTTDRLLASLKASAAYWVVLGLYFVLRISVLGGLATGTRDWALSPVQFLLTTSHLMLSYWQKLALPFQLNAYYFFSPIRSLSDPRAIAAVILVPTAIVALVYLVRRAPIAAFAALWVTITLLPAMNINGLGRNVFTERYLYLPSLGFCLLLTLAATRLIQFAPAKFRKPAAISLLVVVLCVFTVETIQRNPDWKDDKTLFAETLHRSPDAPFVNYMVAVAENEDKSAAAESHYLQAISLAKQQTPPDRLDLVVAYEGLASFYSDRGDNQRALDTLAQARQIADDLDADVEEGLILARTGHWSEAEPLLAKTLAAHPENENALSSMAIVAWQFHNDRTKAAELFLKALAVHSEPDDFASSLHNNLGSVYAEQGNYSSAIDQFSEAIKITPQNPEYYTNLANAYGAAGRYNEARAEAEAALQIAPGNPEALSVLKNLSNR